VCLHATSSGTTPARYLGYEAFVVISHLADKGGAN